MELLQTDTSNTPTNQTNIVIDRQTPHAAAQAENQKNLPFDDEYTLDYERALIGQAKEGQLGSFEEIYKRHAPNLNAFLWNKFKIRDQNRPDIINEAFLKAMRSIDKFEIGDSGIGPWLYRITRNTALDFLKKGYTREELQPMDVDTTGTLHIISCNYPYDSSLAITMADRSLESEVNKKAVIHCSQLVLNGVRKISKNQAQVLYYRYYKGMSGEECAKILGSTVGNIKAMADRAKRNGKLAAETTGYDISTIFNYNDGPPIKSWDQTHDLI